MEIGEKVEFQITGMVARYRGEVQAVCGHMGRPEIRVTHRLAEGKWQEDTTWPTLKDGDYILSSPSKGTP